MAKNKICDICGISPATNYKKLGIYYCKKHYSQIKKYGKTYNRNIRTKNEIIQYEDHAEIILYNRKNEEMTRALIDSEDIEKIKNYKWRLSHGYVSNRIAGISLQNLIMNFIPNKKEIIDHINRNRLDCRKLNLRITTYFVNGFNKGKQSNNTSGYPGIIWNKQYNKWMAAIKINKKSKFLGNYINIEDAIKARQEAELLYFGEIINRAFDVNTIFKKE